jgi:O-antigen/teichoic acid export membrane protein
MPLPPDASTSSGFQRLLRRGSLAVAGSQIASQVVSLLVVAVLYRLLGPEPYGVVGMVLPLVALARIVVASGLDMVTVQQSALDPRQVSALFWVNQLLGLATTAAVAACAPLAAWFYDAPEVFWPTVAMSGLGWAFVAGSQHQALLQRNLRLATLAWIRLAALAAGAGVGVAAALGGWGLWALVVQQYAELLLVAGMAWWLEPWRPQWTVRGVGGRRLVQLGGHLAIGHLALYVMTNLDKVLVGRLLRAVPLGLYSQAYAIANRPVSALLTPLAGVMFPALTRSTGDRERYVSLLLGFYRFILLLLLPAGAGLAIVAGEAMRVLGGVDWTDAGPILALLAPAIPFQGCYNAAAYVLASIGEGRRLARVSIAGAAVVVGGVLGGFALGAAFGKPLWGAAAGYSLGVALGAFPLTLVVTLRAVDVPLRRWAAELPPLLGATAGMAIGVVACRWALLQWAEPSALVLLCGEVVVGVLLYALLARRILGPFLRQCLPGSTPSAEGSGEDAVP